jgi:hypothetical protein
MNIEYQVRNIYIRGAPAACGIITQNTRFSFSTKSCQMLVLLECSEELYSIG